MTSATPKEAVPEVAAKAREAVSGGATTPKAAVAPPSAARLGPAATVGRRMHRDRAASPARRSRRT